jgi:hypothetical protein
MAALTQDRNTTYREGVEMEYPVAGGTKIYAGSLVCRNATGYAVPGADLAGVKFLGVALEQADNITGADGARPVRVRRKGAFEMAASGLDRVNLEDPAYVVDDQTVGLSGQTSHQVACGRIAGFVSATSVFVDLDMR